MDPDRIDFSPLDVTKDELRHERLVRAVMARTRRGLSAQLARVGPRALAVAAGLAVLAWVPALTREEVPPRATTSADPVAALADLAARGSAGDAAQWFVSGEVAVDE